MINDLMKAVLEGNHSRARTLTQHLVDTGVDPLLILQEGLMPGMEEVGIQFKHRAMFLPQVLVAARAMKSSMDVLGPLLAKSSYKANGRILLGTVKGDIHDIGKNLVAVMLTGAGFEVKDLGVACTKEQFLEACLEYRPDILGMSALLTTTMVYMRTVIEFLASHGITVPVIVGGAPVSAKFAQDIGATGFARDATEAVALVRSLVP